MEKTKASDIAEFNPSETLKKGTIAKKVSMDIIRPFCRDILGYSEESYTGGTKFRNGDTIMARLTFPTVPRAVTKDVLIGYNRLLQCFNPSTVIYFSV